jgi:hypothetical protein
MILFHDPFEGANGDAPSTTDWVIDGSGCTVPYTCEIQDNTLEFAIDSGGSGDLVKVNSLFKVPPRSGAGLAEGNDYGTDGVTVFFDNVLSQNTGTAAHTHIIALKLSGDSWEAALEVKRVESDFYVQFSLPGSSSPSGWSAGITDEKDHQFVNGLRIVRLGSAIRASYYDTDLRKWCFNSTSSGDEDYWSCSHPGIDEDATVSLQVQGGAYAAVTTRVKAYAHGLSGLDAANAIRGTLYLHTPMEAEQRLEGVKAHFAYGTIIECAKAQQNFILGSFGLKAQLDCLSPQAASIGMRLLERVKIQAKQSPRISVSNTVNFTGSLVAYSGKSRARIIGGLGFGACVDCRQPGGCSLPVFSEDWE